MASTSKSRETERASSSNSFWDPATKKDLHKWVAKSLEPMYHNRCDADPPVLADYVLALLQHEGNEAQVRKRLSAQLEEFLLDHTASFVDTLLSALRTKAYIPYISSSAPTTTPTPRPSRIDAIPIPLDSLVSSSSQLESNRGRKRGFDDLSDHVDRQPLPKAPRGLSQTTVSRPNSSHSQAGTVSTPRDPHATMGRATSNPSEGMEVDININNSTVVAKPICRDYHHKGYCSRGALCNYSHGEDAVVPPPGMWVPNAAGFNPMMGFMPMMLPFGNLPFPYDGGAYDPNQSLMDMGQAGVDASQRANRPSAVDTLGQPTVQNGSEKAGAPDQGGWASGENGHQSNLRGGRGRGHGRSKFSNRPPSSDEKTLVVEKIPPESLSLDSVNAWFKRFGTVTNVAIDTRGAKALVSFENHQEAATAWNSQDAVFGNRFVKVFWHRPIEGQGIAGKRALEASATHFHPTVNSEDNAANGERTSSLSQTGKIALSAEARSALEKNMAEQKVLFSRLKTADEDHKKAILARIRVLSEGMNDPLTVPASTLSLDGGSNPTTPASTSRTPSRFDRLDKELDLRQAVQDLTRRAQDPSEDHNAIRAELEKLKEKAIAEGINVGEDQTHDTSPPQNGHFAGYYPRRPYRGRGRGQFGGRGMYRGRGGGLKLDNRPKRLIVKGVPLQDDQQLDQIREWHQETGQADTMSFEENGDINVVFRTRTAAEQALAVSSKLRAHVKDLKVFWPPASINEGGHETPPERVGITQTRPGIESVDNDPEGAGWGQGGDE